MFASDTVVRLQHTDAAGIMFFLRIYEFAHSAYEAFLESIGHPIPQDMPNAPYIIPIVHSEADHRRPFRLGDRVRIELTVVRLPSRDVAATVHTTHVIVDPETGKARRMPDDLRAALAPHLVAKDDSSPA